MTRTTHRTLGLCVALVLLILDQIVKYMVTVPLALKSHGFEGMSKIGDPTHLRYIQPACEFVINIVLKKENTGK